MATISVCMIVKNEEERLARCLDSLGSIPDEIVIVDTGSTDKTKSIARQYTAKVYDYEWCDDFASARNFSLSKAEHEYVYVADADEVLDDDNRARFLQLKDALLPEVEVVEVGYLNKTSFSTTENFELDFRPKLFRRLRSFQFSDPIHEALRTDPIVYRSNVVVQHLPGSGHAERDLAHFARLLAKDHKFSARLEMMYARELMLAGSTRDFKAAANYFEMVRSDTSRPVETLRRASCVLVKGAAMERNAENLLRVAAPELVGTPPSEVCCALGDYYLATNHPQQAADWYAAALSGASPELVAASAGSQPLKGLASCFEANGDLESAREYMARAAEWEAENLKVAK